MKYIEDYKYASQYPVEPERSKHIKTKKLEHKKILRTHKHHEIIDQILEGNGGNNPNKYYKHNVKPLDQEIEELSKGG